MSLRDIFLFGALAVLIPMILKHAYIGALAWVVFGVLNPHRLTWGAAFDFQFSQVIAVVTLISLLLTKDHRKFKGGAPAAMLIVFTLWILATHPFAFDPAGSAWHLDRLIKVYLFTGVLLLLLHTRRQVDLLVWCLVISLGFYGTKGGLFTLVGGGRNMVWGPEGTMIEQNNALAVGLVMVIPLMYYLYHQSQNAYVRLGLAGSMVLCSISVLGTHSRGALLAIVAMFAVFWLRSPRKKILTVGIVLFALVAIPFMPQKWTERMQTIETYQEDSSAMGRIYAWQTAYNIAKDRFPIGGGLDWANPESYAKYSPRVGGKDYVAHSIYFQVLGSEGFVGLAMFLLLGSLIWMQCGWIRRMTRERPDMQWAHLLASMTQVGFVGYAVGGAFLDLAFWDVPYYMYVAIAVTQYSLKQEFAREQPGNPSVQVGHPPYLGSTAMSGGAGRES